VNLQEPATTPDDDNLSYFGILLGRPIVAFKETKSIMIQSILIEFIVIIGIGVIIIDHIWYKKFFE
jgi:hypothetical protein